jgi:hypothetical protein
VYARSHSVADALEFTALWNAAMLQTDDLPAASAAHAARQLPVFSKL